MDVHASISEALRAGRSTLDEESGKRVLAANGIKVPASLLIAEPDGASGAFTKLSPPLVAKIVSPDIVHKSDIGGVRVRIGSAEELETALREIESAARAHTDDIEGYLVEEMAPAGHEVVVGPDRTDQTFGPHRPCSAWAGIFVEGPCGTWAFPHLPPSRRSMPGR